MKLLECSATAVFLDQLIRTLEGAWTEDGWKGSVRQLADAYDALRDKCPRRDAIVAALGELRWAKTIRFERDRKGVTIWLLEPGVNGDDQEQSHTNTKKTSSRAHARSASSEISGSSEIVESGNRGLPTADTEGDHGGNRGLPDPDTEGDQWGTPRVTSRKSGNPGYPSSPYDPQLELSKRAEVTWKKSMEDGARILREHQEKLARLRAAKNGKGEE